jgi:predicted O-methyltransferase YrrM
LLNDKCVNIAEIISRIEKTIPGFTDTNELFALFNLVYSISQMEGDIIEIGSWCGRSSVAIALGASLGGHNNPVYCIDLFPNLTQWKQHNSNWMIETEDTTAYKIEHPIYNDVFETHFRPVYDKSENLLDLFRYYISLFDVKNIIPYKGTVKSFVDTKEKFNNIKFVFIDGDHDYLSVVNDIETVSSRLVSFGILAVDDYGGVFSGVTKAVDDTINSPYFEKGLKVTRKLFVTKKSNNRGNGG